MENRNLVIDDDMELCSLLKEYLGDEGFAVDALHDGVKGVETAVAGGWSLVVLDVMLPGINGFEVLRRIRASSSVPVVMLTARGEEVDRIVGLEMGADDYLPKPFNPRELVARIRAVQRRNGSKENMAATSGAPHKSGDITLDPARRAVLRSGVPLELTSVEFSLLEYLIEQAGKVTNREDLCKKSLGRRLNSYDRSIDVHVSSLRRKLGPAPDGGDRIKSIRGVGYIYVLPPDEGA